MTSAAQALPARAGVDRRGMGALAAGHVFADAVQGAVPALLPFLVARHGLSYAAAGALVLAATVSSSVIQPLFGHLSDRRPLPWLMPAGLLAGAVGLPAAGLAPSEGLLFAAIGISGLGVAAFHPEAARFAGYVSGARRATGMSMFILGGSAGWALGPMIVAPAVLAFGLDGTLVMLVPGLAAVAVIARALPRLTSFQPPPAEPGSAPAGADDEWPAFSRLAGVVVIRSFVLFGLMTFVPLYFVEVLGASQAAGAGALAALSAGGAVGTLLGGRLADRIGRRRVLLGSAGLQPPLILAFLSAEAAGATAVLALVGLVTVATMAVTVVIGQELLPRRVGVASGITIGLAVGMGGVAATLFGAVADRHGLETTLTIVAALPIAGFLLAAALPEASRRTAAVRSPGGSAG